MNIFELLEQEEFNKAPENTSMKKPNSHQSQKT
jgi:hypothetical protein